MNQWMKLGLTAASAALVTAGCQREQDRSTGQTPGYEFQRDEPATGAGSGTGGSGSAEEGSEKAALQPPEGEALPDTSDELRPDERPGLAQGPGTGGAGTAGMGMDAGMMDPGTGGAGTGGMGMDAGMMSPGTGGAGTSGMGMDAGMGGAGDEGTGGALLGGEERTEGGTGTEVLQPGETDAKTGEMGTGGAGTGGMGLDAGYDSADGVGPADETVY